MSEILSHKQLVALVKDLRYSAADSGVSFAAIEARQGLLIEQFAALRLALAEAHARIADLENPDFVNCDGLHADGKYPNTPHRPIGINRLYPCPACTAERERDEEKRLHKLAYLALAEAQHEAETLKTERGAALTLAEQRGAAYDMTWREVESLRERLDKSDEERGRQYGLRLEIADEYAFLRELLVAVIKTGTKDQLLDARIAEELRSSVPAPVAPGSGGATE